MNKNKINLNTTLNLQRLKKIKFLLMAEPLTSEQLAAYLKINKPALSILMKTYGRDIHIASWICTEKSITPIYFWGVKENAARPNKIVVVPTVNFQNGVCYRSDEIAENQESDANLNIKFESQPAKRDVSVLMLFGNSKACERSEN